MADDKPQETEIEEPTAPVSEETTEPTVDSAEPEPEVSESETEAPEPAEDNSAPEGEAELSDDELYDQMTPEELEEARANEVAFTWEASEYVHHHKGIAWYAYLGGAVALLVGIAVVLHIWLSIAVFLAMGAAIIVYALKPPRTLTYELTPKGIIIEGKAYPFGDFRSFGVLKDEEWHTIDLEPMKRFAPRITVLFNSADLDSIVGHMELHLPRTDREPDLVERATRYLRF
jgi:hypothetical protein